MTSPLYTPCQIGAWNLPTRFVMAPLTRNRAPGQLPTALMAEYYRQRANPHTGASLIISEGAPVSPMGHGYFDTPGLHSAEQVKGWRAVTQAVHAEGGLIVAQLWHVGRISHTSLLPEGAAPLSSTARAANGKTFIRRSDGSMGFEAVSTPQAMGAAHIEATLNDFRLAAERAMEADFDGVEIHGANGYLIEQFLRDAINDRTDDWGGSIAHRTRFAVEVCARVARAVGADRVGIRLSPITPVNDAGQDSDAQSLYGHLVDGLSALGLAYVHVIEGETGGARDLSDKGVAPFDYAALKARFCGAWMVNNRYRFEMAEEAIASGAADAIAFGRAFIANPDLAARWRDGGGEAPLNKLDVQRLYGGGAEGYTDYPTRTQTQARGT